MKTNKNYVLITGGTSGIGLELSKLFANDGYNLIIVARDENELNTTAGELKQQYNVDVVTISKDLFYPGNAFELYDEIKSKNLDVEILVNDAGQGVYGEFLDTDINREINIINLNITSLVVLTKQFIKDMVDKGSGKILNLASIAGTVPGPLQSVYHGTKAFVLSFSEAIRNELKDTGVSVTALLPGATDTDFFNKADMQQAKIVAEGKLASPADVAKDGYKALMKGDDKIVSGLKNKVQVAMNNIMPDETRASQMRKQQEPVDINK
jgi:short-subunit dehydrogenase